MDGQLAVRSGSDSGAHHPAAGRELEENEDEKIYYGFGVFMGLPLADLKAMKDDFLEQHQSRLVHPVERQAPMLPPPGRADRLERAGDGYEHRREPEPRVVGGVGGFHRRDEGVERPYVGQQHYYERRAPADGEEDDDTSSDDGQHAKSHSINYILH